MKTNTGQVETEKGGQVDAELTGQVEPELDGQVKWDCLVKAIGKRVVKSTGLSKNKLTPERPPNSVIYEPSYITILESCCKWGYGVITKEEILKSSILYLEDDFKNEVNSIINEWHHYKPSYSTFGNYTSTNRISLDKTNYGLNVSEELKQNTQTLRHYLYTVSDKRNLQIKDSNIGNRNYILLLKRFVSDGKLNDEMEYQGELTSLKSTKPLSKILNEIIGYTDIKQDFERLSNNIKSPQKLAQFGLPNIGGLLFYGPPGCGKTYWANWFADGLGMKLYEITRSNYASSYVSGELKGLTEMMDKIPKDKPSVIFFDEFDDIGAQRKNNNAGDNENNKVVQFLLQQIPKLIEKGIIIIAATNFIKKLDTALIRAGRFDKKEPIFPPLPLERSELLYHSLIKNVPANSPLFKLLRTTGADEIEFWKPFGERMLLFSNSYVLHSANEIKYAILNSEEDAISDEISFSELINKAIDTVNDNISIKEREDFLNFLHDLEENKFNKYPERISILKKELDIFFGKGGSNNRNPIGFK